MTQNSPNQENSRLRELLGDEKSKQIIQTIPRRGYVFNSTLLATAVETQDSDGESWPPYPVITLSSISEMHSQISHQSQNDDHEIKFNRAYYSQNDTPLTFYRLPTDQKSLYIYVRELRKLRCLGPAP
ncbi:helix-turn-helix domain-containing protein [Pseudomonas sp. 6D_7.1_Bac1]|jgi:DNA-binding winged helix-turn-helix (wHTH) protein|uniref:helix-turn-helix domain-containing protein n=1 Tax=Pseudomonas sp. 6D_7.1_Bac1 TaxID=2971615 RepID=UPI0021C9F049|nr:helix-turn-helix domain-containing protein [Pseudomonas sp. 6D_7.1_Bac1]MCU1750294.1 helix-turn-helix domain-containing protein [Pseudomonas sp. 6D_7.1_Bac1]